MPRLGDAADPPAPPLRADGDRRCLVVADDPELRAAIVAALTERGVTVVPARDLEPGFAGAAAALADAGAGGAVDAVVVAPGAFNDPTDGDDWEAVLADHVGLAEAIRADAAWARAVADHAAATDRPCRVIALVPAPGPGGRSRAMAMAQLTRAASSATRGAVVAVTVAVAPGGADTVAAELAAHLAVAPDAAALSGAELGAGPDRIVIRSHPTARGSVTVPGPDVPTWLDDVLREMIEPG